MHVHLSLQVSHVDLKHSVCLFPYVLLQSLPLPETLELTSSDQGALGAEDDHAGADTLPRLLDGQVALLVHADDGKGGMHALPSSDCRHQCARDH